MEQHPIPQDVTGFQFKLVGDITLKQFGFLAGGLIVGYITLKIPLIPVILRWPFAVIWTLLGVGLAFLPIEDRPLDVWLTNFIKRIYQPTQFVWKKNNPVPTVLLTDVPPKPVVPTAPKPVSPPAPVQPPAPPRLIMETVPQPPIKSPPPPPVVKPPVAPKPVVQQPPPLPPLPTISVPKTSGVLPSVSWAGEAPASSKKPPTPGLAMPPAPMTPQQKSSRWTAAAPSLFTRPQTYTGPASAPIPITGDRIVFKDKPTATIGAPLAPDEKQVERLRSEYEQTTNKLNQQVSQLQQELTQGSVARERLMELQQVLTQLAAEKEKLHDELVRLKQKLITTPQGNAVVPTEYSQAPVETRTTVKMVTPQSAVGVGMPSLTSQPNVITGIIKDSKGIQLPNLIVTVKDREGVPVRALKSNKLGQFAASTPLANGVYYLEVEDPKDAYQFNRIEVSLEGQVLPPLEIFAVSQKDIVRQQLSRELFGQNTL